MKENPEENFRITKSCRQDVEENERTSTSEIMETKADTLRSSETTKKAEYIVTKAEGKHEVGEEVGNHRRDDPQQWGVHELNRQLQTINEKLLKIISNLIMCPRNRE